MKTLAFPALAVLLLAACGQAGPLVLPERAPRAAPPPPAPAETSTPAPQEDDTQTPERRRGATTPAPETP